MKISRATRVLETYLDMDIPAFLWGAPGVGKSDTVRAVTKERGLGLVDFRALLRDPVDLRGLPTINANEAKWLPPADLPNEERDGKEGIFFMDELNAASPSMQAACFGLVLDRKVGEYTLPDGWRIVAAGNRQSDRAAANKMPSALANRFAHIDVDADLDEFCSYATERDVHPMLTGFLRFRPELLHQMENDLRTFPTPRAWMQASKLIDAPEDIRPELISGLVGKGAGSEFEGFVRVYRDLPKLDECISSPMNALVPAEPASRYAISSGLARKATATNLANIMQYMGRLPLEFAVMCIVDATRRDKALQSTQAFIDFANENQDVLI